MKAVTGFIFGLFVCMVATRVLQGLGHLLFPMPQGWAQSVSASQGEGLGAYFSRAPLGALVFMPLSFAAASLAAGFVSARVSGHVGAPMALALFFTVSGAVSVARVPHPTWLLVSVLLSFFPFYYLGARASLRKKDALVAS